MTCTWTNRRFYTEYINTQLRGDGSILGNMYRPSINGAEVKGGSIYVSVIDIENMATNAVACSLPTGYGKCNTHVALTMVEREVHACFSPCEWNDINADSASMLNLVRAQSAVLTGYLLGLIYADMIANGTAVNVGAVPTGATIAAGINTAIAQVSARNLPGKVTCVLTPAAFALFVGHVGAIFQPASSMISPGQATMAFRGMYLGVEVYITPDTLATAAATPIDVSGVLFHEMGYAYAPQGKNFGAITGFVPQDANPTGPNAIQYIGGCFGYGLLDDKLVYYFNHV